MAVETGSVRDALTTSSAHADADDVETRGAETFLERSADLLASFATVRFDRGRQERIRGEP